eukprot:4359682-Lingulodinium_polyedra.AAC.1
MPHCAGARVVEIEVVSAEAAIPRLRTRNPLAFIPPAEFGKGLLATAAAPSKSRGVSGNPIPT